MATLQGKLPVTGPSWDTFYKCCQLGVESPQPRLCLTGYGYMQKEAWSIFMQPTCTAYGWAIEVLNLWTKWKDDYGLVVSRE